MRMRTGSPTRGRALGLLVAAALLGGAPPAAAEGPAAPSAEDAAEEEPSPRADCCYTNRAFAGVCVVTPEENETCSTILAYLNDPRSDGRDYCGQTSIRGGWQQMACEAPQSGDPPPTSR